MALFTRKCFIALLIILLLQITFSKSKGARKKSTSPFEKKLKNSREELKKTKCAFLGDDLVAPCQNYYISPYCFQQAYGDSGLEYGEVDTTKDAAYNDCYKKS
jgi:hypothetical protein